MVKEIDPGTNPAVADVVRDAEQNTGPSNLYRVMAHRPEAMHEFAQLYKTVMGPGTLEQRLKEMVYLAVSSVNECGYCSAHHVASAERHGLSEQDVFDIQHETNRNFSAKEQAALHYARELTRTVSVENDTRNALDQLFSEQQQVELTMVVALANFTNRFNNGLRVPLEKGEKHRTAS